MFLHYTPMRMHRIGVAGHQGVRILATPSPHLRPNGGGQPWPCACAQGPTGTSTTARTAPAAPNRASYISCTISLICAMTPRSAPHLLLRTTGMQQYGPCSICRTCTLGRRTPCQWTAAVTVVCEITRTMGNNLCVTKEMSTTCRCTQRACERPCPRTFSQCAATVGSRL